MQISNIRKNWTQVEQIYFFLLVLIKIYANCLYFVLSKFTFYTIYFFCGLKIEKTKLLLIVVCKLIFVVLHALRDNPQAIISFLCYKSWIFLAINVPKWALAQSF
jgi:hypothetical protein